MLSRVRPGPRARSAEVCHVRPWTEAHSARAERTAAALQASRSPNVSRRVRPASQDNPPSASTTTTSSAAPPQRLEPVLGLAHRLESDLAHRRGRLKGECSSPAMRGRVSVEVTVHGLDNEPYWPTFLERLESMVRRLPAHLIREEDIRAVLRDTALDHDPRHADPWCYSTELDDVDVTLTGAGGRRYPVELKLWHATLKPASGGALVRSGSSDGTASHVVDFAKQLTRCQLLGLPTWFISLTQAEAHPLAGGPRWHRAGEAGPFLATRPGRNKAAQDWLAGLHAQPQGAVAITSLPPYFTKPPRRPPTMPPAAPGTSLRVRVANRARWQSGGGPTWACDFDLHVWEVQPGA